MKILVANLGSTSFKYRLFQLDGGEERMLAKGGYERVEDFAPVIEDCLATLKKDGHLNNEGDLDAVGFKTVLGKDLSGCVEADEQVLQALDGFKEVAPTHNPAYTNGINMFARVLPSVTRVALFETAFYQWVAPPASIYAVPQHWHDAGVRRYGFHGASHKFIAERSAQLLGRADIAAKVQALYQRGDTPIEGPPLRVISCHLGGSSSVTGIKNGVAIGTSMGFSPQGGLPQNNRVGDLDTMAIPYMMRTQGLSLDECERQLTKEGGLLGISGVSNDLRDIKEAAEGGNERAQLALDHLVDSIRHWAGAFTFKMGGFDAICFTGGIGENNPDLRTAICAGLGEFGLHLDHPRNQQTRDEGEISEAGSRAKAFVIPANEELVIAREVARFLQAQPA